MSRHHLFQYGEARHPQNSVIKVYLASKGKCLHFLTWSVSSGKSNKAEGTIYGFLSLLPRRETTSSEYIKTEFIFTNPLDNYFHITAPVPYIPEKDQQTQNLAGLHPTH